MSARFFSSWTTVLLAGLVGWVGVAHGAQQARVQAERAAVLQFPNPDASVVATLVKGSPLAVSNVPTSGYHKVRTSTKRVGWVLARDLVIYESKRGVGGDGGSPPEMGVEGAAEQMLSNEAPQVPAGNPVRESSGSSFDTF